MVWQVFGGEIIKSFSRLTTKKYQKQQIGFEGGKGGHISCYSCLTSEEKVRPISLDTFNTRLNFRA